MGDEVERGGSPWVFKLCVGYANKADGEFVGSARSNRGCSIEPTCKENEGR